MKLTDIAPLERWIDFEKDINLKSGMDCNVFDTKGYRVSTLKNWANRLCPAIKETDKGQSFICAPAHMNIAAMAMKQRQPVIEECDAGMLKLVVPIFVRNEFIGAVSGCGLLLEDGEVDSYLVNMITGIEEAHVDTLTSDLTAISRNQASELAGFIQQRVEEIVAAYQDQDRQQKD